MLNGPKADQSQTQSDDCIYSVSRILTYRYTCDPANSASFGALYDLDQFWLVLTGYSNAEVNDAYRQLPFVIAAKHVG